MSYPTEKHRKLDNIAIAIVGLLLIACSAIVFVFSYVQETHHERWGAATTVHETSELQALAQKDVSLTGVIYPEIPVREHGLVVYEYWEYRTHYSGGKQQRRWEQVFANDYKPAFELLLGEQTIVVQSEHAILHKTTDIQPRANVKLRGLKAGQGVTVFGQVTSFQEPFEIQADVVCGGDREACLQEFSKQSLVAIGVAGLLLMGGAALAWWGIRRLRK